jgi:3-hydroxyacyl-CoA dehydrogenase/enoyl-CoA hydratase/3-hydroxybutyryl-CoA epimerase
MKTIDFTIDADGIAVLTVDVKDKPMNVITPEFMDDIAEAADQISTDDKIKGAVVTSGKDSFMAGADLKDLVANFEQRTDAAEVYSWCRRLQQAYRKLETCGKPVAAAINGTALGGGLELALACHYRVVGNNPKTRLGQPEVQIGLMPGAGGTQRLLRLMGIEAALRMNTEGKHIAPEKALEMGFVDEVVEPGKEVAAAKAWVQTTDTNDAPWDRKGFKVPGGAGLMHPAAIQTQVVGTALMQKMTNHNYPAPLAIMSATYEGSVLPMDKALDVESKYFTQLLMDPTSRNMTRTLFLNKGAADKLVRRPEGPEKRPVTKLGILGAGMMGAGVAYVSAYAGMQVVLLDTSQDNAEKGKDYSRNLLQKRIDRGRMDADKAADILERIQTTTSYDDLAGCELVIEAVFEDVDIKADVTAKTEPADHGSGESVAASRTVYRHSFLLAGGQDAAGRSHRGRKNRRCCDRTGTRLHPADSQNADCRERQSRFLHQPRVRHLQQGRHHDARRRNQSGVDRECGETGRDAGGTARGDGRGDARTEPPRDDADEESTWRCLCFIGCGRRH